MLSWQQKYFKNLENLQPSETLKYLSHKKENINGDLHWKFKHASDFDAEVSIITKKYLDTGYPIDFIKSVISNFKKKDGNQPVIPD